MTIKACTTVALIGMLTPPLLRAHEPDGTFSRSIMREAARLAEQSTSADDFAWERVRTVSPGTSLVITTIGPASRKGAFVSGDGSALRVSVRGRVETIDRGDVLSVTIAPSGLGGHRFAAGALGAVAGGFAGYAIGYDSPRGQKGIYQAIYVGMPIGIGVGAAAGALAGGRPAEKVYVSHRVSTP